MPIEEVWRLYDAVVGDDAEQRFDAFHIRG